MNQPRKPKQEPKRFRTLSEEIQAQEGDITPERVAAVAARHLIRRLRLPDDGKTWATAKNVILEAMHPELVPAEEDEPTR